MEDKKPTDIEKKFGETFHDKIYYEVKKKLFHVITFYGQIMSNLKLISENKFLYRASDSYLTQLDRDLQKIMDEKVDYNGPTATTTYCCSIGLTDDLKEHGVIREIKSDDDLDSSSSDFGATAESSDDEDKGKTSVCWANLEETTLLKKRDDSPPPELADAIKSLK